MKWNAKKKKNVVKKPKKKSRQRAARQRKMGDLLKKVAACLAGRRLFAQLGPKVGGLSLVPELFDLGAPALNRDGGLLACCR